MLTAKELAAALGARLAGSGDAKISGVASLKHATKHDVVFVEEAASLTEALASHAGAIIAGEFASKNKANKPLLIPEQPRLAFTRAARLLHPALPLTAEIHATAVVASSARLGEGVAVGPHAVIGEEAVIGDRSSVGANSVVGARVAIGDECRIGPNVTIYAGTRVGRRVVVQAGAVLGSAGFGYVRDRKTGRYEQFPQQGRLEIGDEVEIGANGTIDRGALETTVIGRGVKIDNLVHIGHNVRIGENVVIAALTGISGSSVIEENVIIGGQVGIGDHALVKEGVILGSGSGVLTKKIVRGKGLVFWGRPAKPLKQYLKELAALSRLAKK